MAYNVKLNDPSALFSLGYGLYVVTSRDGGKDNGFICNTVMQVANNPTRIAVCVNKANYSHDMIKKTGKMNVCCLTEKTPFAIFQHFGFQSGRDVNKIAGDAVLRSANGIAYLGQFLNAYLSLEVEEYQDLGSHGMFLCTVSETASLSQEPSMTYAYYHANVKPKPKKEDKKKGFVCKICGYVYEGEELPPDFVCPTCKHGAEDFEPIG